MAPATLPYGSSVVTNPIYAGRPMGLRHLRVKNKHGTTSDRLRASAVTQIDAFKAFITHLPPSRLHRPFVCSEAGEVHKGPAWLAVFLCV